MMAATCETLQNKKDLESNIVFTKQKQKLILSSLSYISIFHVIHNIYALGFLLLPSIM